MKTKRYQVLVKFPSGLETTVHDQEKDFTLAEANCIRRTAQRMDGYKGCSFRIEKAVNPFFAEE